MSITQIVFVVTKGGGKNEREFRLAIAHEVESLFQAADYPETSPRVSRHMLQRLFADSPPYPSADEALKAVRRLSDRLPVTFECVSGMRFFDLTDLTFPEPPLELACSRRH